MEPAEAFPLGEHLYEELVIRGWTIDDLARSASLLAARVQEIIEDQGTRVRLFEAQGLGHALGVSGELLLNLDMAYRRWRDANPHARHPRVDAGQ